MKLDKKSLFVGFMLAVMIMSVIIEKLFIHRSYIDQGHFYHKGKFYKVVPDENAHRYRSY